MALIIDIETVGEVFDELDDITKTTLTRWTDGDQSAIDDVKQGLGFSPLTGFIVAIGVYDSEKGKGVVWYEGEHEEFDEGNFRFKAASEARMLEEFWKGADDYEEFVTFNGRAFDAPFLMVRSAVHGVRPTKNLMSNRYLESQRYGAVHIDLLDQLTFYGSVRRRGSLHLWCRAFGIGSPKEGGVSGDDVTPLYRAGRIKDIARYNAGDLSATAALYEAWRKYLKP